MILKSLTPDVQTLLKVTVCSSEWYTHAGKSAYTKSYSVQVEAESEVTECWYTPYLRCTEYYLGQNTWMLFYKYKLMFVIAHKIKYTWI